MFSLNNTQNNNSKENPFKKFKNQNTQEVEVDEFGFNVKKEENVKLLDIDRFYTREDLSNLINLEYLLNFMNNSQDKDGFIKLFSLKIDSVVKRIIDKSIKVREDIVELNKLPEYMKRSDNSFTELKCQATEVPMSDLLRQLNKFNKVKLQTPAITTLTPEKDKPDYILNDTMLFDMKGQLENKPININKIAHDRAVNQGLKYYMVGILNSDNLQDLDYITYYLLPLKYFLKQAKFVNSGQYSENPKNHYYTIKMDKVIDSNTLLNENLKKNLPFKYFKDKVNKI